MKTSLFMPLILSVLLVACATPQRPTSDVPYVDQGQYESILEQHTQATKKYKGLHNTMDIRAVLLNSTMRTTQLKYSSYIYQWDMTQWNEQSQASETTAQKETQVFLSFFTPERKMDDLHKDKSVWKFFLDIEGRRVQGKAKKMTLPATEISGLYPMHNRFSTPYLLSFPVANSELEGKRVQLTITGTIDSATLSF
ncbi:MAG: hypothetical protein ACLGGX_01315 [Bdellovibrionia bacterium]